jgi:hypothetical protein
VRGVADSSVTIASVNPVRGKRRFWTLGGTNLGTPRGNRSAWIHGGRSAEATAAARYLRENPRLVRVNFGYVPSVV